MKHTLALVCGLLLASAPVAAQEAGEETPLFPSEIELVDVDVVVTDDDGAPIRGLTADDFTILEDGVPQSVTSFEAIGTAGGMPPMWAAWTPNFLFLAAGAVLLLRVRT